ncbi:MAG: tetratricopeptide repeat protein [Candidatus Amulumruptor caecigallinarius]|nr:tetratricopeptide repeat protein [Candidatus Amulumruptor caecigallinarius]
MNKDRRNRIFSVVIAAGIVAAGQVFADTLPQRFSPLPSGSMERARLMERSGDYAGVIDRLSQLCTQHVVLTPAQQEEYTYLLARAYYERGDEECLALLGEFSRRYPASVLSDYARRAMADFYFFNHKWPEAATAYSALHLSGMNRDDRMLYTFREALSLIKTGHYKEARPLVNALRNDGDYAAACDFYTAYLDYIDGDFTSARAGFSRVPAGEKGLEAGYYLAQIDYTRAQYADVIARGEELLSADPPEELVPEMQRIVGLSFFKLGEYAKAAPYLKEYEAASVSDGSMSPDAAYALGVCDYRNGDISNAARRFSSLTDSDDPVGQSAWLYLGQCSMKENNPSAAALAFEKAARLDYDREVSETALYNYAVALTRGGKVPFSSSADLLENFARRYPDSKYAPAVETYLATAYYNDRDYAKALRAVNAVKHPGSNVIATKQKILYELGVEALTNGNAEESRKYLSEAVNIRGGEAAITSQCRLWLGDALYSLGRYSEAEGCFLKFLKSAHADANASLACYNLAYSQYKLGKYAAAAANFAKVISSPGNLPAELCADALIRRADCLYYEGDYKEALPLYTKAVESGSDESDYALYRRAVMRGLRGDVKGKLADLAMIEKDYPDSRWLSKALYEAAVTYEENGDAVRAADAYKKRLAVADNIDVDELLNMAATMHSAGRYDDLLAVVEKIHRAGGIEPDEMMMVRLYEADALNETGRTEEAGRIYSALAANPTTAAGAKGAVMVAENLLKQRRYAEAREAMEGFTDAGTPHRYWLARGYIALADALHGEGETYLAREYLTSLRDNYPGDEVEIINMIRTRLNQWK